MLPLPVNTAALGGDAKWLGSCERRRLGGDVLNRRQRSARAISAFAATAVALCRRVIVQQASLAAAVCVLSLSAGTLVRAWSHDARASGPAAEETPVSLPLSTSGRWIVDAAGRRVRLAAVNWYGTESPEHVVGGLDRAKLAAIADWIRAQGFNAVRIPFSNQMWETDPVVQAKYLRANPALIGMDAQEILDRVIDALGAAGLMVILDDHTTNAGWCCQLNDGNGLWYGEKSWGDGQFTESEWIADWVSIARRYAADPWVVGAELRNELREDAGGTPYWGDASATDCAGTITSDRNDWPAAATCAGNAVLAANPRLLVIVDGLDYSTDLTGVYHNHVTLAIPDKLVYAAHNYVNEDNGLTDTGTGNYAAFTHRPDLRPDPFRRPRSGVNFGGPLLFTLSLHYNRQAPG